jgi:hypothetical protein
LSSWLPRPIELGASRPAVFTRIRRIAHSLTFELAAEKPRLEVSSAFEFETEDAGHPILDLAPTPAQRALVACDGRPQSHREIHAPRLRTGAGMAGSAGAFRVVERAFEPGVHEARIDYVVDASAGSWLRFDQDARTVTCSMDFSDYHAADRRHFLERYLPSNPEYDSTAVSMRVEIRGAGVGHVVLANGDVREAHGVWEIEFPDWYGSSCHFFHIVPLDHYDFESFSVQRAGTDPLPVTVFSDAGACLGGYRVGIETGLAKLQSDFGPFPHDRLIVHAGRPGMEYAGAVSATKSSLFHELVHCWFGRSVLPMNGDAGWVDEAIAEWYTARRWGQSGPAVPQPRRRRNMGDLSPYRRWTIPGDGKCGMTLLQWIDHDLGGRLLPFLDGFHRRWARKRITSDVFLAELEAFRADARAPSRYAALFDSCVYDRA